MSLFITSLNSGSNGNCYYIGNQEEAILVDVGISCRETERRMQRLGLSMKTVKAIFVSHEHTDHISGVPVLARKYQLPVYITTGTLENGRLDLARDQVYAFAAHTPVQVGGLSITAFPKHHDAADPHSFIVRTHEVTIGIFTDIGHCCDQLTLHFKMCHAAFLEANYDEDMLIKGRYPWMLKNRIRGGKGHLSNAQALALFRDHKPPFMSHLLLAHLSKDNNDPALVENMFRPHARGTEIIVASRYEETALYHISANPDTSREGRRMQLSLF